MKALKTILTVAVVLTFVYVVATVYSNRIEKIESGEMTLVSESYMDR